MSRIYFFIFGDCKIYCYNYMVEGIFDIIELDKFEFVEFSKV